MEAEESEFKPDEYAQADAADIESFVDVKSASATCFAGVLAEYAKTFQSRGTPFDLKLCNFSAVPRSDSPFTAPTIGAGWLSSQTKDQLLRVFLLRASDDSLSTRLDTLKRLATAVGPSVDLGTDAGLNLVLELATILLTGAIFSAADHFAALLERLDGEIHVGKPLSNLRLALVAAKRPADGADLQYAAVVVVESLREAELSTLFEYFAENGAEGYFVDALVRDQKFCTDVVPIVQELAFKPIQGEVPAVKTVLPAVPAPTLVDRITGVVDAFLRAVRTHLIGRGRPDLAAGALVIARLLANVLLQAEGGAVAPLATLPDVIERAAATPALAEIAGQQEKAPGQLLFAVLAAGAAPDLVRALGGKSAPEAVGTPAYWNASEEIAAAFAPLGDTIKGVDKNRFIEGVSKWT